MDDELWKMAAVAKQAYETAYSEWIGAVDRQVDEAILEALEDKVEHTRDNWKSILSLINHGQV